MFLKVGLSLILLVLALCASVDAGTILTGYIGSHKCSFNVKEAHSIVSLPLDGFEGYLAITEVYPDIPGSQEYHYTVSAKGIGKYERRHRGLGFGPETYFIRLGKSPINDITLKSQTKNPFRLLPMWSVTQSELDDLLAKDHFKILGITHATRDDGEELVKLLSVNLKPKPEYGISTGFSAEIHCVNRPSDQVKTAIEQCIKWSKQYSLPAMLGFVSWWGGTPLREPDGLGGLFGDIKYQQVCYTPDTEHPEDADLKALLEERYNNHYCLSVPNQWSSTPWLTMNSKLLNDYRCKRMDEAIGILKEVSNGDTKWLDNVYIDNEPRYWDTVCERHNKKRPGTGTLWADFNPCVIEAAKKDGIDLNPADGLSDKELLWLHRNVGNYMQELVDTVRNALDKHGFGSSVPAYTHSLQHKDMFPGDIISHPASEWAYAEGARSGLEGMWTQLSDFARVREWGKWANVNREEADGRPIDEHLWDLRVSYMMGADLYNSYNWSKIGPDRFFGYVNEFLRELPTVTMPPAESHLTGKGYLDIKTPLKLQAFSGLTVPVEVTKPGVDEINLAVTDKDGLLIGNSRQRISGKPGECVLSFDFIEPVESPSSGFSTLRIEAYDKSGKVMPDAVSFTNKSASEIKLSLNLRMQRALSLAVIKRAEQQKQ